MKSKLLFLIVVVAIVSSCTPLIAPYDQPSIERCVTVKVETIALMKCAVDSFSIHDVEVKELMIKGQIAYEMAELRPFNEETSAQWKIMLDPEGALAGKFFKMWEEKGKLSQFFISEKIKQVSEGYDQILKLELEKNRKE